MRGRKPKPTNLKELHGSRQPRNPIEFVPESPVEAVQPPDHFNDEQREVWARAVANAPPGMLKAVDAPILEAWVVAHVWHRQAVRTQQRYQLIIPAPKTGYPIVSPWIGVANRQALVMLRCAAELGFSPTARARGATAGAGAADLEDLGTRRSSDGESLDAFLARAPSVH